MVVYVEPKANQNETQTNKAGLKELDGEKNESLSLGGKVVSDKKMDVSLWRQ